MRGRRTGHASPRFPAKAGTSLGGEPSPEVPASAGKQVSLALGFLALAGCAASPPPAARERPTIVSLNPCTDAILAIVADPAQLLAISHYSQDPRSSSMDVAKARRFRATGGTAEEVVALAPDVVKLDMTLVRGLDRDLVRQKLAASISQPCRELNILVVAEGVETEGEGAAAIAAGCDLLQGYLIGRPAQLSAA